MTQFNINNLTAVQKIALAKSLGDQDSHVKVARRQLTPGLHDIPPFTVTVSGALQVEPDQSYIPTTSVSLIGAVSLAVRRMGIQRGPFLKALREVCSEALSADEQTRAAIMAGTEVREFEAAFKEEFTSRLPAKTRFGHVKRSRINLSAE